MLNPVEVRITKELLDNKDIYLSMAKDSPDYAQLEKLYERYAVTFRNFYSSLVDNTYAKSGLNSALKTHKINPYIAGGAGEALGGIGLGLYAASSSAVRNKEIEQSRNYWSNEVSKTGFEYAGNEGEFLAVATQIENILHSIPKIKEYRKSLVENLYQQAKNKMKSRAFLEAKDIFDSIGNYKDSFSLSKACTRKKGNKKQLIIALISLVSSFLVTLYVVAAGAEGAFLLPFFFIVFVIVEITLQIEFRKW